MKAIAALGFLLWMCAPSVGASVGAAKPAVTTQAAGTTMIEEARRRGCGSKGGPGYRKANGKCASWR